MFYFKIIAAKKKSELQKGKNFESLYHEKFSFEFTIYDKIYKT